MEPDVWKIFWFNKNRPEILVDLLGSLGRLPWPKSPAETQKIREQIHQVLPDSKNFVDISILSSFLLQKRRLSADLKQWIKSDLLPGCMLNIEADHVFATRWQAIPVAVAKSHGNNGRLFYVITGKRPKSNSQYPLWLDEVFAYDTMQAVDLALKTASQHLNQNESPYFFPLLPRIGEPIIQGRSLALPLTLIARAVLEDKKFSPYLIATGDIARNQKDLVPVSGIAVKAEAARDKNYTMLILPQISANLIGAPRGIEIVPVKTLDEAWMWANIYSPGNEDELRRLQLAMTTPADFVNNSDGLSLLCLQWLADSPLGRDFSAVIRKDLVLLSKFTGSLQKSINLSSGDYGRATALASLCSNERDVNEMFATDPLAGLEWCEGNLALSCHCGNGREERRWYKRGCNHEAVIVKMPGGAEKLRHFKARYEGVALRHNRYHFEPILPKEYNEALNRQEKIYETNREDGCTKDRVLGTIYGTIAQNYAFCGPQYIEKTLKFSRRACEVFSDGQDLRQQYSYRLFALLDCKGKYENEICRNFLDSITKTSFSALKEPAALNIFSQLALLRMLIQIPARLPREFEARAVEDFFSSFSRQNFRQIIQTPPNIHPWQLWCYNLGRLAGNLNKTELSYKAWQQSIELCMAGGEIMQVMALMPLAELWHNDLLKNEQLKSAGQLLELSKDDNFFHQPHFAGLHSCTTITEALTAVKNNTAKYFPFNYR